MFSYSIGIAEIYTQKLDFSYDRHKAILHLKSAISMRKTQLKLDYVAIYKNQIYLNNKSI